VIRILNGTSTKLSTFREETVSRTIRIASLAISSLLAAGLLLSGSQQSGAAEKVLALTSQATLTTVNPYAESEQQMYFVWCQVYGCLGRLDYLTKQLKPMLAEKWEVVDPLTWRFHLRKDLKRQDGGPGPTSRDVIHSWKRIMTDPASAQRYMMFEIKDIVAVDDNTFDIKTLKPSGQIAIDLFSQFAITPADLYEKFGQNVYRDHPAGWGPYKLDKFEVDQSLVLRKNKDSPESRPTAPDVVIYRQMREPEQRVTAVLNNEVQVARQIPPQLVPRFKGQDKVKLVTSPSVEIMFMAFNIKMKPWDDVRVRRAAAYAINRDAIIKRILFGYADPLDGALGPAQICYDKPSSMAIHYDPAKAKALLAEAGYKNGGPEVEIQGSTGRYISDRQIIEAIGQMLSEVGFKVKLVTPEWSNLWADVRNGKSPAYYMGRGQVSDPSIALSQYFETGLSPRIGYSNKRIDELFEKVRSTVDSKDRCGYIRQVVDKLAEDVPAQFLWTHKLVSAVRSDIQIPADPSGEIWFSDVVMK
jgi:peptide/nickel transport system substrate-binding protein